MKNLQNLKGAKALNRKEQQAITGGLYHTQILCEDAGYNWVCVGVTTGACGCVFGPKPTDKYK